MAIEVSYTDEFGTGDDRFYERMLPIAEKLWNEYLEETGQKKPKKKK